MNENNNKNGNKHKLILVFVALGIIVLIGIAYVVYTFWGASQISTQQVPVSTPVTIPKTTIETDKNTKIEKKPESTDENNQSDTKSSSISKFTGPSIDELKIMLSKKQGQVNNKEKISEIIMLNKKLALLKEKEALSKIDPLDQMPDRKETKVSHFSNKTNDLIISVIETNIESLTKEANSLSGKENPFEEEKFKFTSKTPNLPSLPNINKGKTSTLPDIPSILNLPNITLNQPSEAKKLPFPTNTSNIPGMLPKKSKAEIAHINETSVLNKSSNTEDILSKTKLVGLFNDAAVLNIDGSSKALHVGQSFKGVVVLSINNNYYPKTVILSSNGKQVTKSL